MLPAHEDILSIQLVTNNKYARQVRSCAAGLRPCNLRSPLSLKFNAIVDDHIAVAVAVALVFN